MNLFNGQSQIDFCASRGVQEGKKTHTHSHLLFKTRIFYGFSLLIVPLYDLYDKFRLNESMKYIDNFDGSIFETIRNREKRLGMEF